jgi:M6 family metalloprotease-like protein
MPSLPYALLLLLCLPLSVAAQTNRHPLDPKVVDRNMPDLSEYRTVETVIRSRISRAATAAAGQPGYLGISVERTGTGEYLIAAVEPTSPAAKVGLRKGDVLLEADGRKITDADQFASLIRARSPGQPLAFTVLRDGAPVRCSTDLAATSRPLSADPPAVTLGIFTSEASDGLRIERINNSSPVSSAGVRVGDVLIKIGNEDVSSTDKLDYILSQHKEGDTVSLLVRRDGKDVELKTKLAANNSGTQRVDFRGGRAGYFRKPLFKLAVIPIEYPDVKHNPKTTAYDYEQMLFSEGTFYKKNATGQQVYGSMNDYYVELSCGKFRVTGKVFDWVEVRNKRADYANSTVRNALLTEAIDKLLARDGEKALDEFDGVFFLYAGDRFRTNRGGLYWPHRSTLFHRGKRFNYFICPEGGNRMDSISVMSHEFGHMLGLPDLYARPEAPGSEGLGIWCTMSNGHGRDGKPLHMSSWCKIQLGWLTAVEIDPSVKQKIRLRPIENSPTECIKIPLRPDGSEYLLLENRRRNTYDRDLPAEGLLIWRIVDNKPVLEESHGIEGPEGPRRYLGSVPYPSPSNNSFTPYTQPSSRAQKGGGLPVYITNITKQPDGSVTFWVGYEYF